MRNVVVGSRLRLEVCTAKRGVGHLSAGTVAARLRDVACAGHIPIAPEGTLWDTLVITPCNWWPWRSRKAEGTFPWGLHN